MEHIEEASYCNFEQISVVRSILLINIIRLESIPSGHANTSEDNNLHQPFYGGIDLSSVKAALSNQHNAVISDQDKGEEVRDVTLKDICSSRVGGLLRVDSSHNHHLLINVKC